MAAILKAISDLNVSPFEAAMGRMERRVDKFASGNLAAIGRTIGTAFGVYAVARFAASVGKAAEEISDVSKATGVGVENLQALNVLFIEGGKSAGDVASVMGRLKKSMDEATVDPKMAQSFIRLGISFEELTRQSPERILEMVARAMRENAGDMQMGEAAGNLLGRSYAELQGIMSTLASQGLDPLRESLKATNQIMGEDAVAAADKMQDAYDKLGRQMRQKGGNAAVTFFGGLQAAYKRFRGGPTFGDTDAAESLFGKPDPGMSPADMAAQRDRRNASADAMRKAAFGQRDKAVSAADEWFKKSVASISVSSPGAADSLGRIGGYIGGQASPETAILERQIKILELQKQYQDRIAKATEATAGLLEE